MCLAHLLTGTAGVGFGLRVTAQHDLGRATTVATTIVTFAIQTRLTHLSNKHVSHLLTITRLVHSSPPISLQDKITGLLLE